jgi:hypothetical protein
MFQLRGLAPQTGRTSSNILIARIAPERDVDKRDQSEDREHRRHLSRATLSRYSRMRMEARRRALDGIATRQREADEKRKKEAEQKRKQEQEPEQEQGRVAWLRRYSWPYKSPTRTERKFHGSDRNDKSASIPQPNVTATLTQNAHQWRLPSGQESVLEREPVPLGPRPAGTCNARHVCPGAAWWR